MATVEKELKRDMQTPSYVGYIQKTGKLQLNTVCECIGGGVMFSINELRNNMRRAHSTRRVADRRVATYAFGSVEEWQANIAANYVYCPNVERRLVNRRGLDRRALERRQLRQAVQNQSVKNYHQLILTREERKLIEDIYLYDRCQ